MSYTEALERLRKCRRAPDRRLTEPTEAPSVSNVGTGRADHADSPPSPPLDSDGIPVGSCPHCSSAYFWSNDGDEWVCARCLPPERPPKSTLTVPGGALRVVSAHEARNQPNHPGAQECAHTTRENCNDS